MPKAAKHYALTRQWEMLNRIPRRQPGITARELTERLCEEGFEVSKRTVERDLNELSRIFGLATHTVDSQTSAYWYFAIDKVRELGSVSLCDAAAQLLVNQVMERVLPEPLEPVMRAKTEQAEATLRALSRHPAARIREKFRYSSSSLEVMPPYIRSGVLETVQEALIKEQQLCIHYAKPGERAKEVQVHPLSLILKGSVPYLIATAWDYADLRRFALHRIEKAVLLEESSHVPEDYSVDRYIAEGAMEFGEGKQVVLTAWVTATLAFYLAECPLGDDQTLTQEDDGYLLRVKRHDSWNLYFWILSHGPNMVVHKPAYLRKRLAQAHQAAAERYAE
jgi:predicted DNA-binding transcriptional regulator YafY